MRFSHRFFQILLAAVILLVGTPTLANSKLTTVKASDIQWRPLNPARGKNSPQAGTLWGDRNRNGLSGFLVKFKDGFSSPPHIHNVGYRGVVISGEIHNDDPKAANLWMSQGSFWTQPAGESHITSAKGDINIAYIEIDRGPYLVWPAIKAFDDGVRPVNIEAQNIVWQSTGKIKGMLSGDLSQYKTLPEVAFVWGKPYSGSESGMLLKLPVLSDTVEFGFASQFRAIVISGIIKIKQDTDVDLKPGSYFGSLAKEKVLIASAAEKTIIYVKSDGKLELTL